VAAVVGIAWWLVVRPWLHNLWSTGVAFASGYLVHLLLCAMLAYSAQERTQARKLSHLMRTQAGTEPVF
jgi:hypothetical protein